MATTFDGFPMARAGRPGFALGLGVWSSFFGGIFSAVVLVTLAPQLARIGLEFQQWDYFALIVFALTVAASLAGENLVKGLIAGAVGLLVATVGEDEINGVARFHFGNEALKQGFGFLPVLIGLFAFSQLLSDLEDRVKARLSLAQSSGAAVKIEHRKAAMAVLRRWKNLLRSSLIGIFTGILPAAGSSISNILAYDQAMKASKEPEKFGTGCEDGIIAPESANNATAGGALITMMALGIPGDIVTAVMLGALLIHDVIPSPTFIIESPVLAYSLFLAFFVANFMMLALQSYTLRLFVLITRVRMYVLASVILAYAAIGVFALGNVTFDIWTLFWFGILGYLMRIFGFPLAPMILGVVLGRIAEQWLSRSLARSDDLTYFVTSPWSLFFLILAAFSVLFSKYQADRGKKAWTLFYPAIFMVSLSVPAFMMGGAVRIGLGILLIALGIGSLVKHHRNDWKVDPTASSAPQLRED